MQLPVDDLSKSNGQQCGVKAPDPHRLALAGQALLDMVKEGQHGMRQTSAGQRPYLNVAATVNNVVFRWLACTSPLLTRRRVTVLSGAD